MSLWLAAETLFCVFGAKVQMGSQVISNVLVSV